MELTSVLSIFKEFRDWLLGIDKATLEHSKEEKSALLPLLVFFTNKHDDVDNRVFIILGNGRTHTKRTCRVFNRNLLEWKPLLASDNFKDNIMLRIMNIPAHVLILRRVSPRTLRQWQIETLAFVGVLHQQT